MKKTNAARILDRENISYTLISYELDETGLSAVHVAQKTGYNINQIFKTLVLRGETTGIFVCVIPGGNELDLKKTAGVSGNKRVAMRSKKNSRGLRQ
jgi:Cys-tRNA(Pro)/Cys-tRNA(Cys) deacylase